MNPCVKTGAWLYVQNYYAFFRCDTFVCGNTYIFQADFSNSNELDPGKAKDMGIIADYEVIHSDVSAGGNIFFYGMRKGLLVVQEDFVQVPKKVQEYQGFEKPSQITHKS